MIQLLFGLLIFASVNTKQLVMQSTTPLAEHEFSLAKRYNDKFVNDVFRDNILLTLAYASGEKINPQKIDWERIEKTPEYKIVLKPGETFAFHDDVLPQYESKATKFTNAHFNAQEGFKSDGYLVGDGVCHLASLLYWVAKDAGLKTLSQVRHDFAPIPEVPKIYSVSIYDYPGKSAGDQAQNLYITNDRTKDVAFEFKVKNDELKITALEI